MSCSERSFKSLTAVVRAESSRIDRVIVKVLQAREEFSVGKANVRRKNRGQCSEKMASNWLRIVHNECERTRERVATVRPLTSIAMRFRDEVELSFAGAKVARPERGTTFHDSPSRSSLPLRSVFRPKRIKKIIFL